MAKDKGSNNSTQTETDPLLSLVAWCVRHGRTGTAVAALLIGGGIYAYKTLDHIPFSPLGWAEAKPAPAPPAEPDLFPNPMVLTVIDSSSPEAQRKEHKDITLKGSSKLDGLYAYKEKNSHGFLTGFRRIDGTTIDVVYGSSDPSGYSLGSITLRKLHYASEKTHPIWIGFETGHDCTCGDGKLAHQGPFTSLPAVLTEDGEIPKEIEDLIASVPMNPEPFLWPDDIEKALGAKALEAKAKAQEAKK